MRERVIEDNCPLLVRTGYLNNHDASDSAVVCEGVARHHKPSGMSFDSK